MKIKKYLKSPFKFLSAVLIFSFLCSCTNLSAIRDFADISSSTADNTSLTKQYVSWPVTQKRFQPIGQYAYLDQIAAKRSLQEKTILLRHKLIEEYMNILSQLATDDIVTYDKKSESLGKAAKDASFLDENEKIAFNAVSSLILKASTDAWRQKKLKGYILDANKHIKIVIGGLKNIVDHGFLGDISAEREAIRKYYDGVIADSNDKAGIAALNEWRELRLESLQKREKDIKTYSLSLAKISEGHQRLYDGIAIEHVWSEELLAQIRGYAKDLQKSYKAITSL